jgi:hypothetical protein
MLKPSVDFSSDEILNLLEALYENFNVAQVYAFKQWYNERYLSREFQHLQDLLPKIYFFELRKCENGALAIILATYVNDLNEKKEFHTLLLFNKSGAYSRFSLNSPIKKDSVRSGEIYEKALDNSILVFSK